MLKQNQQRQKVSNFLNIKGDKKSSFYYDKKAKKATKRNKNML